MKSAGNTTLQNLLANNRQLWVAHLYTFTLSGGSIFRYTDADLNVTSGGFTFLSTDALFKYTKRKESVGLAVASFEMDVYPSSSNVLLGSTPWIQAALQGQLDYARVQVERAYGTSPGDTSSGTVILFNGRISDVEIGRSMLKLTVKSDIELLNVQMPRNLYQPGCLHELFDAGCTLNPASFRVSGAVTSATASVINATLAQATGYFDMGVITMTSGVLNGLSLTVKSYVNGTPSVITLLTAFRQAPAGGDTFTILPGCAKTQSVCTNTFNNLVHFRGQPYIPQPEAALAILLCLKFCLGSLLA